MSSLQPARTYQQIENEKMKQIVQGEEVQLTANSPRKKRDKRKALEQAQEIEREVKDITSQEPSKRRAERTINKWKKILLNGASLIPLTIILTFAIIMLVI